MVFYSKGFPSIVPSVAARRRSPPALRKSARLASESRSYGRCMCEASGCVVEWDLQFRGGVFEELESLQPFSRCSPSLGTGLGICAVPANAELNICCSNRQQVCMHMRVHLHACVRVSMDLCIHLQLHLSLYIYIYIYTYMSRSLSPSLSLSLSLYVYIYIYIYTYIHIHTYVYIYMYTHTHACACIHVIIHVLHVYIYIYRERERRMYISVYIYIYMLMPMCVRLSRFGVFWSINV